MRRDGDRTPDARQQPPTVDRHLLEQRHVRVHAHQFIQRRQPRVDVPAHYFDHLNLQVLHVFRLPRRLGAHNIHYVNPIHLPPTLAAGWSQMSGEPDGILKGYSPALRLSLCWDNEMLRFYDPGSGDYLRNFEA